MPPKHVLSPKHRKTDFEAEWDNNDEHIETDFEKDARLAKSGGKSEKVTPFEAKDGYQQVTMSGGGIYKGFVKGGKFEGRGEIQFSNGDVYDGNFKDDYRHGNGVFTAAGYEAFAKGLTGKSKSSTFTVLRYQGNWVADKREGSGEALYSNGDRFSGSFKSNRPHGPDGVYLYGDGRKYEGSVKMGMRDGKGCLIMKNNDAYTGDFKANKIHGKGVMRYGGGANTAAGGPSSLSKVRVFEGEFNEGKRVRGSMAHPNGKVYDGEWSSTTQRPHGFGKCTMRCGDVYKGEWNEGRMQGRGRLTYHSGAAKGRIYDGEWSEDKPNGKGCMLLPNGDLVTCSWKDGKTDPDAPSDKVKGKTHKDLPSMDWYKKGIKGHSNAAVEDLDIDLDDLDINDEDIDIAIDDLDINLDDDVNTATTPAAPVRTPSKGAMVPPPRPPVDDGWCDGLEGWDLHDSVAQEDFTTEDSHHAVLKTLRKTGKVEGSKVAQPPVATKGPALTGEMGGAAGSTGESGGGSGGGLSAGGGDGNVSLTAKVVHSGWLEKYSIGKSFLSFGNWKTRYFTLFSTSGQNSKGGFLMYYTTEQSDVNLGSINLAASQKPKLLRSPTVEDHKKVSDPSRDLVLQYTEEDKEYSLLLRCSSQREHDAWVLYLSKVVQDVV